ncbi:MAG: exodeoxyribonuclease VII large subunit, partial [Desulfobulbaceae bacterium]|nr:exodeoxyribonuclease VII large subunit [Desulfobulbaceae bacterium]
GEYQLLVDTIESLGEGQLQIAFAKLKSSLAQEGLFDQSTKQPLPFLPNKVSLITSPGGAAVHDFLRMADNRYPGLPIEVIPTRVQGESAAAEIVEALTVLNQRKDSDVIILCRGGGSLEDLWAFNEETVARAIYASEIPVVSAIGHEIDFTISDFVADFRAATPTAAAETVIPDRLTLLARINRANYDLGNNLARIIDRYRYRIHSQQKMLGDPSILLNNFSLKLRNLQAKLGHALKNQLNVKHHRLRDLGDSLMAANPGRVLSLRKQRIDELSKLSHLLIRLRIEKERERLAKAAALLDAVSPLTVLGRGYSITLGGIDRKVIRDSSLLEVGNDIEIILAQGGITAKVTEVFLKKK